jgi:hypothetical protein
VIAKQTEPGLLDQAAEVKIGAALRRGDGLSAANALSFLRSSKQLDGDTPTKL